MPCLTLLLLLFGKIRDLILGGANKSKRRTKEDPWNILLMKRGKVPLSAKWCHRVPCSGEEMIFSGFIFNLAPDEFIGQVGFRKKHPERLATMPAASLRAVAGIRKIKSK
jgi:hypothetical protein